MENKEQMQQWLGEFMAKNQATNSLRERNQKTIARALHNNEDVREFRESMVRRFGIDAVTDVEKFPAMQEGFSWKAFRKELNEKLKEADSSTAFTQFLRAGIQQITAGMYQATQTTFEDWVTVVASDKQEELYAPMHGVSFPRQVGVQSTYPEVAAAALDIKLKNYKFGALYAVEKELLDDDQTGQFQRQAGLLGEYMKLVQEVWIYGKLASVAGMQYQDLEIPTSETKPSYEASYPWSTALRGGGATKPAAFGALTQGNIQSAMIALRQQKNLQGIIMNVNPKRIVVSPYYAFDLAVLLNSSFFPSGASAAGQVGGAFAVNVLKGIADATVTPYLFDHTGVVGNSKAWYVMDDSKPFFICQNRVPVAVEQENPLAGESFARDVYRFKAYSRFNADFIDPRFAFQGSNGSV